MTMDKHLSSFLFILLCLAFPISAGAGAAANAATGYQLIKVFEVAGRQGIATDGHRYFVSDSKALYTYSKDGKLLNANEQPFADLDGKANHIGDISVHKGELYAGVEWFKEGQGHEIQIVIYDTETLKYKRSIPWEPETGQVEVSAVAVDAQHGLVWLTDWVNGKYVYSYELASGKYAGKLHLRPVPQWQQGIAAWNSFLFITADDGDAEQDEADNLWKIDANPNSSAVYVSHELKFDSFRDVGEIEGVAFDPEAGEMVVLANRGKRIVLGIPQGLYPGYEREIHELYIYRIPE